MDLLLSVRPGRGCTVVEVRGDLDMATAPQLHDGLQRLVDAGDRQVVVDMAAVQPAVLSVLKITSVDRVIDLYDTVQAAEAAVPSVDGTATG